MYKLKEIDDKTHDQFLTGHPKEHFMQTSTWGQIKSQTTWKYSIVGLFNDDKLLASTLLLKRKMPIINKYMFYAPRGFIIDFEDQELLKEFTVQLKDYLRSNKATHLLVDPDYYYRVIDNKGNIECENTQIIDNLKRLSYKHSGFSSGFNSTQPRYTFRNYLNTSQDELFSKFSKVTRQRIKKAQESGMCAYQSDDIDTFYEIISETAMRDNFIEAPKSYYELVYKTLKEKNMGRLYHCKYDPKQHLDYVKNNNDKLNQDIKEAERLNKSKPSLKIDEKIANYKKSIIKNEELISDIQKNIELYPEGIVLSAGITINSPNRAWTIFGGSRDMLRELNANYVIKYQEILDFNSDGFEFVDLFGAIDYQDKSNKLYGIHEFKQRFGGKHIEFCGEFNLIISPFFYFLINNVALKLLKLYKKIYVVIKKHS